MASKRQQSALIAAFSLVVLICAPAAFAQWGSCTTPGYLCTGNGLGIGTTAPNSSYFMDIATTYGARIYTTSPTGFGGMTVQGDTTALGGLLTLGSGRGDVYAGIAAANWTAFITTGAASNGFIIETYTAKPLVLGTNNTERLRLDEVGNISITGNVTVSGNIAAKYQDFAEWVPSGRELAAGTVVILNTSALNNVEPSDVAYDTKVAGVVSERPGVILGEGSPEKSKIATSGRVRVNVDASKHPVRIGDLLVTSDKPGYAMVSEPITVAGVKMHRPGTIIGKALEPLAGGNGQVLVLLSLQ